MKTNHQEPITKWDKLLVDINLFLCEHYGYRDSAYWNTLSIGALCADSRAYSLYIRFWENVGRTCGLPDNIIVLARTSFYKGGQEKGFTNLLRFLKAYAPLYGFEWIGFEDRVDNLDKSCYGFPKQNNIITPYAPMKIADLILPEE